MEGCGHCTRSNRCQYSFWRLSRASQEEKEQWELLGRIETQVAASTGNAKLGKSSDGPFLTISFPVDDLFDDDARDLYLFIRNIGNGAALDVQVATLSRKWNGNIYEAEFPRLQIWKQMESPYL
jgi:hypothetical protein